MFYFYILLSLIVTLKAQNKRTPNESHGVIDEQHDERAKKPWIEFNEERPDIYVNNPHCGRSIVPKEQYYDFKPKCFKNSYPDKTYEVYENYQSRDGGERDSGVQSRVLWGKDAQIGEAPWAVFITTAKFANQWKFWKAFHMCSGTLITLEWVMTAAHCIDLNKYIYVHAGNVAWESGPKRWANKKFRHPEYIPKINRIFDIGLLKLNLAYSRTVINDRYIINPVCLPKKKERTPIGGGYYNPENVTFYGYGVMQGNNPLRLQRADLQLIPDRPDCERDTLCVYHFNQTPRLCYGDSGGGLVFQVSERMASLQVGVQERVQALKGEDETVIGNCVPPILPFITKFANVALVMDWILDTITNN